MEGVQGLLLLTQYIDAYVREPVPDWDWESICFGDIDPPAALVTFTLPQPYSVRTKQRMDTDECLPLRSHMGRPGSDSQEASFV